MREGFTKRRCPNCGGNIFAYQDLYGGYEQCLQCSRIWYFNSVFEAQEEINTDSYEKSRKAVLAGKS